MSMEWKVGLGMLLLCASLVSPAQAPPCAADREPAPGETNARGSELEAFHEVIMPLWHTAWPEKDTAAMKAALPEVQKQVKILHGVTLPGILRDRQEAWSEGLSRLDGALEAYEKAASGGESQPLLDAVERLHAAFEGLVSAVWPKTKELDAYHQVLYRIVHYYAPAKDAAKVRQASQELKERCRNLLAAPLPPWAQSKEKVLRDGFQQLCKDTDSLADAAAGGDFDAAERALGRVHSRYQAVEALFEE
ncbi:MAG: hypothetical protein ACP5VN_09790 [Acidobacteriota bacterium]